MIECTLERDERMGWNTYVIRVGFDGRRLCLITDKTDKSAVDRFVALCETRWFELSLLLEEAEDKIEWNHAHPGRGMDWPVFGKLERIKADLLKQAGIKDT